MFKYFKSLNLYDKNYRYIFNLLIITVEDNTHNMLKKFLKFFVKYVNTYVLVNKLLNER